MGFPRLDCSSHIYLTIHISQSVPKALHTCNDLAAGRRTLVCLVELEDHRRGDDEDKSTGDHHSVNTWMVGRLCKVEVSQSDFYENEKSY